LNDDPTYNPEVEEDPNVKIDIVYQDITVNYNNERAEETQGYVAIIGMICIILALISVAVCLYKKIISQAEIRKAEIPEALEKHPDLDSHGFEDQYVPNDLYKKKTGVSKQFGGVGFDKKNTRSAKVNDDLVFGSNQSSSAVNLSESACKLNDTEGALVGSDSRCSIAIQDISEGMESPMKKGLTPK